MVLRRASVLTVFALFANIGFAQQWTKLHTFPSTLSTVLFLNESVGFAGIGIGPGAPYTTGHDIYKTTDGG